MDWGNLLGLAATVLALWGLLLLGLWWLRPRDTPIRSLVALTPDVLRLIRAVLVDRTSPLDVRLVLGGAVLWVLSPIDLVPEFIPVLGPLDDILVAVLAVRYARRRLGEDGIRARWTGSADGLALLLRVLG